MAVAHYNVRVQVTLTRQELAEMLAEEKARRIWFYDEPKAGETVARLARLGLAELKRTPPRRWTCPLQLQTPSASE